MKRLSQPFQIKKKKKKKKAKKKKKRWFSYENVI